MQALEQTPNSWYNGEAFTGIFTNMLRAQDFTLWALIANRAKAQRLCWRSKNPGKNAEPELTDHITQAVMRMEWARNSFGSRHCTYAKMHCILSKTAFTEPDFLRFIAWLKTALNPKNDNHNVTVKTIRLSSALQLTRAAYSGEPKRKTGCSCYAHVSCMNLLADSNPRSRSGLKQRLTRSQPIPRNKKTLCWRCTKPNQLFCQQARTRHPRGAQHLMLPLHAEKTQNYKRLWEKACKL